jgi:MGT family glycosyltransferase
MSSTTRILIGTVPADGHVAPGLPIARELVQRGHEVVWYTGRDYRAAIEATGACFEPIVDANDPADEPTNVRLSGRMQLEGLAGLKFDLKHLFLDELPGQLADLRRIMHSFPADVIVGDTMFLAAPVLHELGGPPFATFGISILPIPSRDVPPIGTGRAPSKSPISRGRDRLLSLVIQRLLFRDVQRHHLQVRSRIGLPATSTTIFDLALSPYLYLHGSSAGFEYPRRDLPAHVHFVGPLLPAARQPVEPPPWWGRLHQAQPVVLVTQGTVATDLEQLAIPAIGALANEDVFVVVTAGAAANAWPHPIPANTEVVSFVPFAHLMPHVDVMVTNGGYGGVQFALAHGVPIVIAGTTEEKPEIAARVAWSGTGISLRTKQPTPQRIAGAVRSVLTDQRYRYNAQRIADEISTYDAAGTSADLIERLVATGRTVPRSPEPDASLSEPSRPGVARLENDPEDIEVPT